MNKKQIFPNVSSRAGPPFKLSRYPLVYRSLVGTALGSIGLLAHAQDSDFIANSTASLNLRNYYINDNFVGQRATQGKAEEWTQSFIFDARSGFTQGWIGFGADVLGLYSQKLDGGRGTGGTQLLPLHDGGDPADNFGRLGMALKARIAKSEFKLGEWAPALPVFGSDDGRSLPQTVRGAQLQSRDIQNVVISAGQFRANSPRDDASMEKMWLNGRPDALSDRFNFLGGQFSTVDQRTSVGLWGAQLKDIYRQQYLHLRHNEQIAGWRLGANVGLFHGSDDGAAKAGALENRTWYTQLSLGQGPNTFLVGVQRVSGESGWMRVNGSSGGELGNDSFNSSYENANERSWQIRHDFDFVAFGLPGLTMMNRYLHGDNIQQAGIIDGKEWGRETELSYLVQSGPLASLSVRWRNSSIRRSYGSGSFDENVLVINYPLQLL